MSLHGNMDSRRVEKPTKKLRKGGVLRNLDSLSLARFSHSCVRNALQEMEKVP
jgi:hypothetical protein